MSQKEVIEKAYSNIPREVGYTFDFYLPTYRGIKYYYHRIVRYFSR